MPIYAYRCGHCGHTQDVLQKLSDAPLTVCPACGQPAFSKQLSAPAFQLKGSGWYVTDFRDNGKKPDAAKEGKGGDGGAANGDSGGAGAGKTDSGKSDTGKSDSAKTDSGKGDAGKAGSGKSDAAASGSGQKADAKPAPSSGGTAGGGTAAS